MKLTYRRLLSVLCAAILGLHLLVVAAPAAQAQFFDDSQDQQDAFVQDEENYFEDTGTGSLPADETAGAPSSSQDYTEGNKYVDESLVPISQRIPTTESRRLQLTLGSERQTLPLNVAWGAGTGLLIGGWYALLSQGDNRATQRSIGMGIVSGILLGLVVGTRTVFDPNAPKAARVGDNTPPPESGSHFAPLVALNNQGSQVGFRFNF